MTTINNLTAVQRQAMGKMFDRGAGYGEIRDYLQGEGFSLDRADRLANDYVNFCAPTTEHPEKDLPQSPPPIQYSDLYEEVSSLMALAAELVDDHAAMVAEDSNQPTWDYVGDMKHALQLIKQLVAFLSPDGE